MKEKVDQASFRPVVGIDLGTTNSGVAMIVRQHAKMMKLPNGNTTLPSVVMMDEDGPTVGEEARNALVAFPERTVSAVKRRMGEDVRIPLGDEHFTPEELSAFILKALKKTVDQELGEGEKEAVITVPAYFTNRQRQATKRAGELAGFVVERIINEPTAAALAYGLQHLEKDADILVYDLGGGTFDVSVVELMSGILEVKASAGNHQLGGEDFDWAIVDWLMDRIRDTYGDELEMDARMKAKLKEEAEKAKIRLSVEEQTVIDIPVLTLRNNAPVGLKQTFGREDFLSLIEPKLLETKEKTMQVLDEAGLTPDEVDNVLLVGGSTRIPYVHDLVQSIFHRSPEDGINPDEVVALGAAVQGGIKSGALDSKGMIVTDVAPFSMGIAVLDPYSSTGETKFNAIIEKNTTIPVTRTRHYSTTMDDQTDVQVNVYQGESDDLDENYYLNGFLFKGLPKAPATEEKVDVTFRYNLNGILEVTAKSRSTKDSMQITIDDALDRSSEEAFYESLEQIERAGAQNEPENEEMDLFGEDEELREEAEDWISRFREAEKSADEEVKQDLSGIIRRLEKALKQSDVLELMDAVNEAVDLAIDLELDE